MEPVFQTKIYKKSPKMNKENLTKCLSQLLNLQAGETIQLEPLQGGFSEAGIFLLKVENKAYILRTQGADSFENHWSQQLALHRLAAENNLAPKLIASSNSDKLAIMEKVEGQSFVRAVFTPNLGRKVLIQAVESLKTLHSLSYPAEVLPRRPLDFSSQMMSQEKDLSDIQRKKYQEAVKEFLSLDSPLKGDPLCLCHNDPNPMNILYDGSRLYLIDWETSGLNHPYFDLATLGLFLGYGLEAIQNAILQIYLGQEADSSQQRAIAYNFAEACLSYAGFFVVGSCKIPEKQQARLTDFDSLQLTEGFSLLSQGKLNMELQRDRFRFGSALFNEFLKIKEVLK